MHLVVQAVAYSLLIGQAMMASGDKAAFAPIDVGTGNDSECAETSVTIAQSVGEWEQLWQLHRGASINIGGTSANVVDTNKPPILDFRKVQVIGIFGGRTINIEGYRVVQTKVEADRAVIRIQPITMMATAGLYGTPYALVVVPRIKKTIDVEFAEVGSQQWRLIGSFPPPK